jgi:hypothetical protein
MKKKFIAERFQFSKFFNDLSVYVLFRGPIGFRYLCCLQQVWDPDLCTTVSIYYISTIYLSVHQKYGLHSLCHLAITLRSLLSLLSLHQAYDLGSLHRTAIFVHLAISPPGLKSPLYLSMKPVISIFSCLSFTPSSCDHVTNVITPQKSIIFIFRVISTSGS